MYNEAIIQAAYVVSFAICFSAVSKLWYSRRPRLALATVSVGGVTDPDGEQLQGTVTIFKSDSKEARIRKLEAIWELREYRLKMQNDRMLALHAEQRRLAEEAKDSK